MASATNTPTSVPRLRVRASVPDAEPVERVFDRAFRIGRTDATEVCIKNEYVSRQHVEVAPVDGKWWIKDLGSSNGIFVAGNRVETWLVERGVEIRLGIEGPTVSFAPELPPPPPPPQPQRPTKQLPDQAKLSEYASHYFGKGGDSAAPAGERTMYIRQAFAQVQKKQKRQYGGAIAAVAAIALAIGGYAFYEHQQMSKQKAMAENIFYAMKSLDVDIANLERLVLNSSNPAGQEEIRKFQVRRNDMEKSYDQFLSTVQQHERKLTPQERLILRVARIFGECELDMPPEFETEINNYIGKWKSSGRLARAIQTAKQNGYTGTIVHDFLSQDLPPQFFYLALQESDFNQYISGPMTRKGIAKGMWQFIPETALKYGLHLGPLVELPRPDPGDDRHHWDRATVAATRYIKELYGTDAQASGLLVMACYNWGEDYVLPLVRSMPANPRDRNFWKLLTKYRAKIPQETYDYVFYISSAAVIGENPRLFGFDFDNPLSDL